MSTDRPRKSVESVDNLESVDGVIPTPLGTVSVRFAGERLTCLQWEGAAETEATRRLLGDHAGIAALAAQLKRYFDRDLVHFDIETSAQGSAFQAAVWAEMCAIPYGATRTYGEIAQAVGGQPQAVGWACGSNPIAIVQPCHRVVASGGTGGFSGNDGVPTKCALLALEGAMLL